MSSNPPDPAQAEANLDRLFPPNTGANFDGPAPHAFEPKTNSSDPNERANYCRHCPYHRDTRFHI